MKAVKELYIITRARIMVIWMYILRLQLVKHMRKMLKFYEEDRGREFIYAGSKHRIERLGEEVARFCDKDGREG